MKKRDRTVGKKSGVAVYIHKNTVNCVRRTDLESKKHENIVIEIILTTSKNTVQTSTRLKLFEKQLPTLNKRIKGKSYLEDTTNYA